MLSKKERLNREDFNRFFAVGKRVHTPLFTLIWAKSPQFHASVVVSKKVAKGAVTRNKIRRRIYDALRRLSREDGVKGVYIVLTKKDVVTATYTDLKATLLASVGRTVDTR